MPKESKYASELLQAIKDNNLDDVKHILETKIHRKDKAIYLCVGEPDGKTSKDYDCALVAAAKKKDPTIIRYMIENGADINMVVESDGGKRTKKLCPLHLAVTHGLHDTATALLEANANVNQIDERKNTPLHVAIKKADVESARMLLWRGADVRAADQNGLNPLQIASKFGHVELVRLLLEHNAQVFQEGQKGVSPLHIAAREGHVTLIDIFGQHVDVNIKVQCTDDKKDKTALHLACEKGLIEAVRVLVERFNADVNVLDSDGQTALHCALLRKHDHRRMRRKEDYDLVVDLLLKKGVHVNHINCENESALHLASRNQYHRAAQALLVNAADPTIKNNSDKTPLEVIPEFDIPMKQIFTKHEVFSISVPLGYHLASSQPCSPLLGMDGRQAPMSPLASRSMVPASPSVSSHHLVHQSFMQESSTRKTGCRSMGVKAYGTAQPSAPHL